MSAKILMVCLGNICRSPLAEGILKSKLDKKKFFVDSAGTAGYHVGNPPDERSVAVAQKYGLDISNQRCRQFETLDFLEFDHIYVMDRSNYANVVRLATSENQAQKVKLLLEEVDLGIVEVPDPYHDDADGFENVFQMIEIACDAIAKKLS
ncbi:low molecular weight phosphotyrosine protein phosphatase [Muricauda sp. JGD-17]|uniref:protein-tyrosine-phosphatase n=1 Tax=Flagellimonas ochracea TaxID=2696472 RepID=A0A964TAF8_9FLAO|nr:low molecular weight protein-tyrosine-phosphatase [Allomuricauda ochracea]NAY90689.1 low molecular weight phosphotyrosine protein phosphatase [Allomuricauda ochracea]